MTGRLDFVDLKTQYAALRVLIAQRIQCVPDHGQYIMGPEAKQLEERPCARPERTLPAHTPRRRGSNGYASMRDRAGPPRALRLGVAEAAQAWSALRRVAERGRRNLLAVGLNHDWVCAPYTVFVDDCADLQARPEAAGIPTTVHHPKPVHRQSAYAAHAKHDACPNAGRAAACVLTLPMSADLSNAHQDRVTRVVRM